jgi:hypothetical protein
VALAFKLEEGKFGQLTYMRIYSGSLARGDTIVNVSTGKRLKVSRCWLTSLLIRPATEQLARLPGGVCCATRPWPLGSHCLGARPVADAASHAAWQASMGSAPGHAEGLAS